MSRKYDIAIFGATGLTGKYIVQHVYELSTQQPGYFAANFEWAIAGRNESALNNIIDEYSARYPRASVSRPAVLLADVTRRDSLDAVTQQSKVLINAVGPFRFMGEYVVRSCVEQGCDYVDITGEPEFIERMQRTYHDQAKAKNVTIVHACGFDSVPSDMGVIWLKQAYQARGWTPTQIEMFLRIHTGPAGMRGGYATYESAVHGFSSVELLREIRKASNLAPLPRVSPDDRLKFHKSLTFDQRLGYHVPFMFADPSVVRLSQQLFLTGYATKEKDNDALPTVQFAAYLLLPSLFIAILYHIYGFIFSLLAPTPWGRRLLLKYPEQFSGGLFSKQHPTEDQLNQTSFEMILRSKGKTTNGSPEQVNLLVRGPELGYVATPRIVLQCALTILNEKSTSISAGVLTPGAAFWQTDLIRRLRTVGVTYDEQCPPVS
ncbi:saccharopine dehydrogenase [Radiomyces spectabilis]|uniref:saccharopine dehydrogenase n=1 Tax=Radiomyces spectabilis TaxID=64574 RepID=UPI00221FCF12|nr:saccharopine dehydrogenase [Radiomyces spectabilis]KAI8365351.1 saccharopine dehydrogenase [Radiomyces spectabilis]